MLFIQILRILKGSEKETVLADLKAANAAVTE